MRPTTLTFRLATSRSSPRSPPAMLALRHVQSRLPLAARQALPASYRAAGLSTAPVPRDRDGDALGRLTAAVEDVTDRVQAVAREFSPYYEQLSERYKRMAASRYGRLMRLDQPTGSQLLFLPAAWGIAAGATSVGDVLGLSALFYGGAVLVRGAGCTVNDIWDADVDGKVARTATRPIAAGEVSIPAAVAFSAAQFLGGLGILTALTPASFMLGTATLVPVLYYPLAKRVLKYPQAALAFTFNSGALIGYAACTNALALPAVLLYGSGVCWTMVYDTIYGHQDKEDDRKLGLYSTALQFGENTRPILAAFAAGQFSCLLAAGMLADLSTPFYMGTAIAASRVFSQVYYTDLNKPEECGAAFKDSAGTGALIWGSILAGRLF